MKYKVGDRVWMVKPPIFDGDKPCIQRWYPRWGTIVAVDEGNPPGFHIRTGPHNTWWYYLEDIEDPFIAACRKALK